MMEITYLTTAEVQRIAGNVSRQTIWRWVRAGIFPAPRSIGPAGGRVGFVSSEVEDWARDPDAWRAEHARKRASAQGLDHG